MPERTAFYSVFSESELVENQDTLEEFLDLEQFLDGK